MWKSETSSTAVTNLKKRKKQEKKKQQRQAIPYRVTSTHQSIELAVLDHCSIQTLPVGCKLGGIQHNDVPRGALIYLLLHVLGDVIFQEAVL